VNDDKVNLSCKLRNSMDECNSQKHLEELSFSSPIKPRKPLQMSKLSHSDK